MPSVYNFSEIEILGFVLILIRVSVFLAIWPIFWYIDGAGPCQNFNAFRDINDFNAGGDSDGCGL